MQDRTLKRNKCPACGIKKVNPGFCSRSCKLQYRSEKRQATKIALRKVKQRYPL